MSQKSARLPRRLAIVLGGAALAFLAGCDVLPGQSGTVIGTESTGGGAPATTPTTATPIPESSEAKPAPPIPVQTTEPCNYPTTVPGGTVPPNLCADATETTAPPTGDPDPGPQLSGFTCPNEDYPIVMISTSWTPYDDATVPFTWCSAGGVVETTEAKILVPTEPFAGIAKAERIGVELSRMPGGIQWFGTVAIPSQGARLVQLKTTHRMFPADFDEFDESCADLPEVTVRGVAGCVNGNDLIWSADDVFYILTISPQLGAEWSDVITWTNTWSAR